MIYLDYAATTPMNSEVADLIARISTKHFGNPSSIHAAGRSAKTILEQSREQIAGCIDAEASELMFTSGGTEADNIALLGAFEAANGKGKRHLIIGSTEHHAVLHSAQYLESRGVEITRLPVDRNGVIDPNTLTQEIRPETFLVSIMHANNEIGTIQDIPTLSRITHDKEILFHTDAVQSFGKIPVSVADLGVDLLSLSAHKLHGPKAIGALYVRRGVALAPIFHGGGQESGRRPGTENVALSAGFALAADQMLRAQELETRRLRSMRERMKAALMARFTGLIVNGHPEKTLHTILSVSFDHAQWPIDGDALIMNMDLNGIAVTSGSACTSGSLIASHVLLAAGLDKDTARTTIRFSFGRETTDKEIDHAIERLDEIIRRMMRK
jgi:cysteine desulfurase